MATYDHLRMMNQSKQGFFGGSPIYMGGKEDGSKYQIGPAVEDPEQKFAREEAERQRQFTAQQNDLNRQAQLAPLNFRQQLFDKLYPGLSGMFSGTGSTVGGQVGQQPSFAPSPVYNDDQIRQQVNASVSANDTRYGTFGRLLNDSQAARGFGSASPAAEAMRNTLRMGNARENAVAEREIPFQAAQANQDAMFRGSQLQQQMWRDREDSDIRRRQAQLQGFSSILGLLG